MVDKTLIHRRSVWYRDMRQAAFCYIPAGYHEECAEVEPTIVVPDEALRLLVAALDEEGFIKPRLDERLRAEDLKITHRVLDLLKQAIGGTG